MLKRVLFILKIISVIILIQGCTSISEFYHCRIYSKETKKRDFIINLIKNPNQYDSILHNSEFYHPEYSQYLDNQKSKIIKILNTVNYENDYTAINDAFLYDINNKITTHDIAYFFDKNNILFNKNVLSLYYDLHNSERYITSIQLGNYRIELLE